MPSRLSKVLAPLHSAVPVPVDTFRRIFPSDILDCPTRGQRRLAALAAQLLLILLVGAWTGSVFAQNTNCRNENPDGTVECTAYPPWETPWIFHIPGPGEATDLYSTLAEAIEEYKGIIVDSFAKGGWTSCDGPPNATYPVDNPVYGLFPSSSFFSHFNYDTYEQQRNTGILFVWIARQSGGECQAFNTLTFFAQSRGHGCGPPPLGGTPVWQPRRVFDTDYCERKIELSCAGGGAFGGPAGSSVGNPVGTEVGTKTQTETDYSPAGGGLRFERTFQSTSEVGVPAVDTSLSDGRFGKHWRHNFDKHVWGVAANPVVGGEVVTAYVQRGSTTSYFYKSAQILDGKRVFNPRQEQVDRLSAFEDLLGNITGWEYVSASDDIELYDAAGRLLSSQGRDGQVTTYAYDVEDRLVRVTDPVGRSIGLAYDGEGRIAVMTDPTGGAYDYAYDAIGNLLSVTYPADGQGIRKTRQYRYENAVFPRYLTGIIDENGARYATYGYDEVGRAVVTKHHAAPGVDVDTFTLDFTVPYSQTVVTDPLGTQRTYTYQSILGVIRTTGVSQPCATCGTGSMQNQTYDAVGFKDKTTDFNGTVTDIDTDTRGLEIRRIEAQGKDSDPAQAVSDERKTETVWDAILRVPLERSVYACSAPNATPQPCTSAGSTRWQRESLTRFQVNARGQTTARCEVDPGDPSAVAYLCGSSATAPDGVRQTLTSYCDESDLALPASTCPVLGQIKASDGARTDLTDSASYSYYPSDDASCAAAPTSCPHRKGDLHRVVNALGQTTEYQRYDGAGRVLRIKDANGVITDLGYHARGWLQTRSVRANADGSPSAGDATTSLAYDGVGQVTRITQADGAFIDYGYDDAHRLIRISDNLGNRISYTLDPAGNRTAENTFDPANALTRNLGRVYDNLGRLHQQLTAASGPHPSAETTYSYDPNGNSDTLTDALGNATDNDSDPLNRLIRTTDALLGQTQYRYDARDNLTQVTDAEGLATEYVYNGLNDQIELHSPDTGSTVYSYDSAGNRASQTDARGVTSSYHYDALNRLIAIDYPTASNNLTFSYDQNHAACPAGEGFGIGRLTGFSDPSGSTQLCYDRRGNLTRKLAVVDGQAQTIAYTYNLADRITSIRYPSGTEVNYGRDSLGRIVSLSVTPAGSVPQAVISAVDYYPFGPVRQITWASGQTQTRSYDQNYWIEQIDSNLPTPSGLDLDFTLDAVGNITALSDVLGGQPPNNSYVYDPLYRLSQVYAGEAPLPKSLDAKADADPPEPQGLVEAYTYDAIGNRRSKTIGGNLPLPYSYSSDSHRLLAVGASGRSYDANGNTTRRNLTTRSDATLGYDERNRLVSVASSGGTVSYRHNARGERVYKQVFGKTSRYAYDEAGRLLVEDASAAGGQVQEFLWLDDLPVGLLNGTNLYLIQPDHLGSPRKVTNQKLTASILFWHWPILDNPFGEAQANQDPDGDRKAFPFNLRFPGQQYDPETGLHYNYFRDYEPGVGRYVESDPIGLDGGDNTFLYVFADPLAYFDPHGLDGGNFYTDPNLRMELRPCPCLDKATLNLALNFTPLGPIAAFAEGDTPDLAASAGEKFSNTVAENEFRSAQAHADRAKKRRSRGSTGRKYRSDVNVGRATKAGATLIKVCGRVFYVTGAVLAVNQFRNEVKDCSCPN
ncbi:MAG: RHS repeat-associated core domain-containing protein [Lysobacterales bacterium]